MKYKETLTIQKDKQTKVDYLKILKIRQTSFNTYFLNVGGR